MAYPSDLDLQAANIALARISERGISAFNENSPAARAVARLYPVARALMFAAAEWRFATARALLNPATGNLSYPWLYEFPMPGNVSRVRQVLPTAVGPYGVGGDPVPFEEGVAIVAGAEARVIRCDLPQPVLIYTQLILDPALWDDGFFSAFTVQLAAELALPITNNAQLASAMRTEAQQAVAVQQPAGQAQSITPQSRGPSTTTAARDA